MTNLVSHLREVVREQPEKTAVSVAGNGTTYSKLWAMTGRFAAGLVERGVEPGDAVALYLPNLPQFVVGFHGTLRAGGVVVPMNPQYKAREIGHMLSDSEAAAVLTTTDRVPEIAEVHDETDVRFIVTADGEGEFSTGFADFLGTDADFDFWELAGRDDDDLAVQPYTSGTTGDPKGVELTHGNLAANTHAAADLVPDGVGTEDASLGALPLFHIYGMTVVMNATLLNGGTFYPVAEWDAGRALELVDGDDLSILHGVPAMYNDLVHHEAADDHDLSSVRLAGVGGSGMPVEVLHAFEDQFDPTLYEGYGLTETSPVTHFNAPSWGRRVGSIGKPLQDVEAMVVDDEFEPVDPVEEGPIDEDGADLDDVTGELVVSGPNVMRGYHHQPAADQEAFTQYEGTRWFHTGDVAYHDEDGYYYVVDRKSDLVVTGGYNVYPREVEELLFEHEAVADAAVVGVPDERRGETVKAYVVAAPGADADADAIREFCREHLAEYKHPRIVEFVDELPRTSTGKVQKFRLREQADPIEHDEEGDDASDGDAMAADTDASDEEADDASDGDATGADTDASDEEADDDTGADDGDAGRDGSEPEDDEAASEEDDQRDAAEGDGDEGADDDDGGGEESDGAGTAEAAAEGGDGMPGDIEEISGVGPAKGETLRDAGFDSVEEVRAASLDELAEVEGIGEALAEQILEDVETDV
jgi:long-chain acyl-CoA synthetase